MVIIKTNSELVNVFDELQNNKPTYFGEKYTVSGQYYNAYKELSNDWIMYRSFYITTTIK